mmetsp:Transcript_39328/g.60101  ORF Transcript_39328/g.60101 Transcript_39328/m.60101 type:complete len:95 (+) Transcript_39328:975-1259(+)
MKVLAQCILNMVLQLIAPHYILIALTAYIYKPRLSHMIESFQAEMKRRNLIVKHLKVSGLSQLGAVYEANCRNLETLINNQYQRYKNGGFVDSN